MLFVFFGRAAAYGIHPDQLEEHYRKRTTLLVNIYPKDKVDITFICSFLLSSIAGWTIIIQLFVICWTACRTLS